jgi:hypothetical protein
MPFLRTSLARPPESMLLFLGAGAAAFSPASVARPALLSAGHASLRANVPFVASAASTDSTALKGELMELMQEVTNRGIDAPQELAEDILEVAIELDESQSIVNDLPVGGWSESPLIGGNWRLLYTSSRTFANNQGLSGYARDISGVETPELLMKVETTYKRLIYEEPLTLQENSMAALFGKFANAKSVQVECVWRRLADDAMGVSSQRIVVGGNSWEPADRQDKAVRTLGAGRPVFLDDDLLVLRSFPEYVVWVFGRVRG